MNNEKLILERLDCIEAQLAPIANAAVSIGELKDDLIPLGSHATQLIIKELEDVESSFQLEDFLTMLKQFLRSVRDITYSLRQLGNIIDFVTTLEPLLRSTVPQLINYLDDLERRGVFRIIGAALGVRAKIAQAYTPEDIEKIGDGLVALLGLAKKMTSPQSIAFLEALTEMPTKLDLSSSKDVGPFGAMWALNNKEVKEGLGVLIELTKGMGKLKSDAVPKGPSS